MRDKLTVKEAAEYLNTTRQKISRLLKRGVLQAEVNPMDTRYKLIKRADLDKLKEYAIDDEEDETATPETSEAEQELKAVA